MKNEPITEMDKKAGQYDSPTEYLVLVDKKSHILGVYRADGSDRESVFHCMCTLGAPETPTPSGSFLMRSYDGLPFHWRCFDVDDNSIRCWWATRCAPGGYLIHSVLYTPSSSAEQIIDGRLGVDVSYGCIRVEIEKAKWIYDNIPENSRCVIY